MKRKAGQPRHYKLPKTTMGIGVSVELLEEIDSLPQLKVISKSYLVEQILRQFLGMPTDYSDEEMARISQKEIVE